MNDLLGLVKGGGASSNGRPTSQQPDIEAPPAVLPQQPPAPGPPPASSFRGAPGGPPSGSGVPGDPEMDAFFAQVAQIKALMVEIRRYQSQLEQANERSKTVTRSTEMHELREIMQTDANTIARAADAIKKRLAELERTNEAALKRPGCGKGSSSERTRTAITGALKKKLKDQMGEFQSLRSRLQREYREVVERRVFTVTGRHADEAEIDRMIDAGEGETVFQKAILEQGRGYVLDTLAEIRERRDAVVGLERSLMELHQIFLDMAVLVEAQGQMIDNIEAQVAASQAYVSAGTTHLVAAKRSQKRSRRCLCCLLVFALLAAAAVAIVLAITLTR